MKIINQTVDEVRRQDQPARPQLKRRRYIWLKNQDNLTRKEQAAFERLKDVNLKTARAYHLKLNF